jgi:hypothetical protein
MSTSMASIANTSQTMLAGIRIAFGGLPLSKATGSVKGDDEDGSCRAGTCISPAAQNGKDGIVSKETTKRLPLKATLPPCTGANKPKGPTGKCWKAT